MIYYVLRAFRWRSCRRAETKRFDLPILDQYTHGIVFFTTHMVSVILHYPITNSFQVVPALLML
jgi:hypothetical protein